MHRRILFVLFATLLGCYFVAPTVIYFSLPKDKRRDNAYVEKQIPKWLPSKHVRLGLDLDGGVQLVLGVNTDGAIENKLGRIGTEIMRWAEDKKMPIKTAYVLKGQQTLRVEFTDDKVDPAKFRDEFHQEFPGLRVSERGKTSLDYRYEESQIASIRKAALDQADRVVRSRVDKWGVSEPIINRRVDGSILVQLAGQYNPEQAKELLGRTAQLQFKMVDEEFAGFDGLQLPEGVRAERNANNHVQLVSEDPDAITNLTKGLIPQDRELVFEKEALAGGKKFSYRAYVLHAATELSGEDILDSGVTSKNEGLDNSPVVSMRFTGPGGKRFADLTGANIGKRLAIVLDNEVVSAPNIRSRIPNGSAIIEMGAGGYQKAFDEASQLSLILKSGALPATITVLEERQVGSTLGPELAQQGVYSILVGLLAVMMFMIFYYRRPGVIACLALALNGIFLMALLVGLGTALSLPGIAGFILTLGVAVDANVLINERIRQEIAEGRSGKRAVEAGFTKVFWTIFDSNVTTLIAGFVLLETSTSGPIRGFAVTLILGLIVSLFTALYCSRAFFEFALRNMTNEHKIKAWLGVNDKKKPLVFKFDFIKVSPSAIIFGLAIVVATIVTAGTRGINWSVDFAGGTELEVLFKSDIKTDKIRDVASQNGFEDLTLQAVGGSTKQYIIRFDKNPKLNDQEHREQTQKFVASMRQNLKEFQPDFLRVDFVGPQIGREMAWQGVASILLAIVGILVYVALRFDLRFGPGAIAKMLHDVLVMLAFYVFAWRSFDLTSIAALLTVVGYSVNDVIVIYDRIRENLILHPRRALRDNINMALNETLIRSLNTSLSTILSLLGVLILGSAQIWNFAAAMVVGVASATFTSTFLATSCVLWFEKWGKKSARPSKAATA